MAKRRGICEAAHGFNKSWIEILERRCYMAVPANDMFADAQLIDDSNLVTGATPRWSVSGDNIEATYESGEPFDAYAPSVHGPSIWYRWIAGRTGEVQADANNSDFYASLNVYTGFALDNLVSVPPSIDMYSTSIVRFTAQAGTTYWMQVYGSNYYGSDYRGQATLNVSNLAAIDLEPIAQVGGSVNVISTDGTHAYVGGGQSLSVLDLSEPSQPLQVGSICLPNAIKSMSLVGNYAYVAAGAAGLFVVDVSDPASPTVRGRWHQGGIDANAISVAGGFAYITSDEGMEVIDVSDPAAPVKVGSQGSGRSDYGVSVSGGIAVVLETQLAEIVDVSDPAHPVALGNWGSYANAVSLVGSTAYSVGGSGLNIRDVSDPANPKSLGGYAVANATGVSVVGNLAYVACSAGMLVIDVSNPASPAFVASIDASTPAVAVSAAGGVACLATGFGGLKVIDVSDPGTPVLRSTGRVEGAANDVAIVGNRAYVAKGGDGGLTIYDVTDPTKPTVLGQYPTENVNSVLVSGNTAYLASGYGLSIIDVSDPARPRSLGWYSIDPRVQAVHVTVIGTVAYVATQAATLLLDVSDLASPRLLFEYSGGGYRDVAVVGNRAYLAFSWGFKVLDVSDPANPVWLGQCSTGPGSPYGLSVVGSTVYVACAGTWDFWDGYIGAGLMVVDVSDLVNPHVLGTYTTYSDARKVRVAGSLAYVADDSGLEVFDISNPANILRLGGNMVPATDVVLDGGTIYAADGSNGVVILGRASVSRPPTDLNLSATQVGENQPVGTVVGGFTSIDPNDGDIFTYSLVSGSGSEDNGSFAITGNQLLTAAVFNLAAKSSYSIRVRTTDQRGMFFDKVFGITVLGNQAPTDIVLSASSIAEKRSAGTEVGTLSTTDPDAGNTFTYSLVSGTGSADNASFSISGNQLLTAASFNFDSKNSYSIRLRTTDQSGLWFEKTFTIGVINVADVDWSSYLGGSGMDAAYAIALDGEGNAWVTGYTSSSDLGSGGFDTSYNGGSEDAFVAKINANGTLAWFSYLGGSGYETGYAIAIDGGGNAWVTGNTSSSDWVSGGFDTSYGGARDAFVAKINANGTLAWSSYLGGVSNDYGFGIATDGGGNAWVAGRTQSPGWVSGGFDTSYNGGWANGFVAKINSNGTLAWSSYVGDDAWDVAVDAEGSAWVTGQTSSSGWVSGGFDTSYNGGGDAFVAKINTNGTLAWSSYLGGSDYDESFGIAIDGGGNAWVTGGTSSSNWASGGFDTSSNGNGDAFVAKINANGALAWSSYLGGSDGDAGSAIAIDGGGNAWVTGWTVSPDWVSGGFDTTYRDGQAYVGKINADGALAWSSYLNGGLSEPSPSIAVDGNGHAWVATWTTLTDLASGGFDTSFNGGDFDGYVMKISDLPGDQSPTDITLSASSVAENQPVGTAVGMLSSTDSDAGNTFTYSLVPGAGSADNASFTISGDQLLTAASFNYEAKSSYSVRVRTTDQGGLWFEKVFTITVTDVDEIAPTATAVFVRGSTWNSNYLSFLAANLPGSSSTYGYAIPVGSGTTQLQTLPWRNLNRISIAFSEDVSVSQAQFAIVGSVGSYSVSGFSYNATDHVATWSLSAVIGADKLYVALPGSGATPVTDVAGNALDGEWTNPTGYNDAGPTGIFPSGNGVAGGDFAFRFDVLPGDSTGGSLGKVNVADIAQTKSRSSLPETTSSYRSDFDGNNLVNVADIAYVKTRSSISSLPVNAPVLPTFGPVFSQVSLLTLLRGGARKLW